MLKKVLCVFLVLVLCCVGLCGCGDTPTTSTIPDTTKTEVGVSESRAKELAASALYSKLSSVWGGDSYCDVTQTRYSIGSVKGNATSGYTVNGQYTLYDKYGNFKRNENFSVTVSHTGSAKVTEY